MRRLADAQRVRRFMEALACRASEDARTYFTGGATAVLIGWRELPGDRPPLISPRGGTSGKVTFVKRASVVPRESPTGDKGPKAVTTKIRGPSQPKRPKKTRPPHITGGSCATRRSARLRASALASAWPPRCRRCSKTSVIAGRRSTAGEGRALPAATRFLQKLQPWPNEFPLGRDEVATFCQRRCKNPQSAG
jgi:hypothetical protein